MRRVEPVVQKQRKVLDEPPTVDNSLPWPEATKVRHRKNANDQIELLRCSFSQIIHFKDDEGRPIGEYKAPPRRLKGVPMELAQCRYQGSRYLHSFPMNISALKQMRGCWPEVIGSLDFLRKLYLKHHPCKEISLFDLWRISRLGGDLPGYLLLRERDALRDKELPAFVAALFKVVIGITSTIRSQFLESTTGESDSIYSPGDPALVYEYAERRELLIGKEQVCAGPQIMIMETLQLLTYGRSNTEPNSKPIKSLIPSTKSFFDYSCHMMSCQIISLLFDAINHCIAHDASRKLRRTGQAGQAQQSFLAGLLNELDEVKRVDESGLLKAMSVVDGEERARLGSVFCSMLIDVAQGRRKNHLREIAHAMASIWKSPQDIMVDRMMHFLRNPNGKRESPDIHLLRPIVEQLVIYLEVEWLWLQALTVIEACLKESLGRVPTMPGLKALEVMVSDSSLRSFFQRAFHLKFSHSEKETIVRRGRAVMRFQHSTV